MKKFAWIFALVAMVLAVPAEAAAPAVVAQISISRQSMSVSVNGFPRYNWVVSTARKGYRTPVGTYRPQRLERMWYSRKYDWSPMPHAIFFRGGYAIHGTGSIKQLGRPASHGCVRLHPQAAATLYSLVKQYGAGRTRIIVTR